MDLQKTLEGLTPEQLADFLSKNAPAFKAAKSLIDSKAKTEADAKRKAKEDSDKALKAAQKALDDQIGKIKAIVEKAGIKDARVTIDVSADGTIAVKTGTIRAGRPAGSSKNGSSDLTAEIYGQIQGALAVKGVKPVIKDGKVVIGDLAVTKRQAICAATLQAKMADKDANPGKKAVEAVFGAGFFGPTDAVIGSEQQKFKTGNGDSKMVALVKELSGK